MTQRLLLLTPHEGQALERLSAIYTPVVKVEVLRDARDLQAAEPGPGDMLLSVGTGVIISRSMLERLAKRAYNLHPASPDFPGRDPHHHAIWRQAERFGATLHEMTERVDSGPIVGVELFDIEASDTPYSLLSKANDAGFRLLERIGPALLGPTPLPSLSSQKWGQTKTSRSDFRRLAHVSALIGEDEFLRRFQAFDGGEWNNLTLDLHGRLFRIDKNIRTESTRGAFQDFTEGAYRAMLRGLTDGGYRFASYCDAPPDRHVIWRHDVDFSMHRAARLAQIEAEEGARAVYFLNPHCTFYNLLEPEIMALTAQIVALGHEIGLHFDAGAFPASHWERGPLEDAVRRESRLLEMIVGQPVRAMSWHNPDMSNLLDFGEETIGGLANAYSTRMRRDYAYCSDSNGYWRFKPMPEVIAEGHERLHLLTHPAWWTLDPMAPSDRIDMAIMGRARAVRRDYDALLARGGRKNVKG